MDLRIKEEYCHRLLGFVTLKIHLALFRSPPIHATLRHREPTTRPVIRVMRPRALSARHSADKMLCLSSLDAAVALCSNREWRRFNLGVSLPPPLPSAPPSRNLRGYHRSTDRLSFLVLATAKTPLYRSSRIIFYFVRNFNKRQSGFVNKSFLAVCQIDYFTFQFFF